MSECSCDCCMKWIQRIHGLDQKTLDECISEALQDRYLEKVIEGWLN